MNNEDWRKIQMIIRKPPAVMELGFHAFNNSMEIMSKITQQITSNIEIPTRSIYDRANTSYNNAD